MNKNQSIFSYIWILILLFMFLFFVIIIFTFFYFFYDEYWFWIIFFGFHWISLILLLIHFQFSRYFYKYKFCWIFIISLLPWIGIILYFFIGNFLGYKSSGRKWKKIEKKYLKLEDSSNSQIILKNKNLPNKVRELFRFSTFLSKHSIYVNVKINLLKNSLEKFQNLKKDIEQAKKYIYLNYFILSKGDCFDFISDILIKKLKEGIEVRIIYDFLGTIFSTSLSSFYKLRKHGAKLKSYGHYYPIIPIAFYRNHRKDIIIDGEIAYTGGFNIGDEYCGMSSIYGLWSDTHARVLGPIAKSMEYIFLKDWEFITKKEIKKHFNKKQLGIELNSNFDNLVQVIDDGPQIEGTIIKDLFIRMISMAKKRVWMITPYLLIDQEFEKALIAAANTGVDIRIIIPEFTVNFILGIMRLKYIKLIKSNIKIYEFSSSYIHSKIILIDDDICTIGTTNLDFYSFYTSSQTTLLIYDKNICKKMEKEVFERDFKYSILKDENVFKKYNKFYKIFLKFIEMISAFI